MAKPSTNILDHIVHLSPPGALQETIGTWKDAGYTVVPGGTHADGLTENALVAFADGIYIELISFVHPVSHYPSGSSKRLARENHAWAKKQPGFIDFALLGNDGIPSISKAINDRSRVDNSGVTYVAEVKGGRTRKDGEKLEWLISAASSETESVPTQKDVRGRLPFFCGDLTPRDLRVPHTSSDVTHPNTSQGVAYVKILASPSDFEKASNQISSVIGTHPKQTPTEATWLLQSPNSRSNRSVALKLSLPARTEEKPWLDERGIGIYEAGIRVEEHASAASVTVEQYHDEKNGEIITVHH